MDSTECPVCQSKVMEEEISVLKKEALVIEQTIQNLVHDVTQKKNRIKRLEEQVAKLRNK